jgi:GH15 family glucan-1,4-alpha-glucosidase
MRSLLTLKGLTYHPTGGLVATLTTSLPEMSGGALNWDYRSCWLRDATFTVGALLNAGYREEATLWRDWMLRSIAADPNKIRIMYRLDGNRHLDEANLEWLPGNEGAAPVRLGNKAADQRQIDVVGELLDALALMERGSITPTEEVLAGERDLAATWKKPGRIPATGCEKQDPDRSTTPIPRSWPGLAWIACSAATKTRRCRRTNPRPLAHAAEAHP